jgi:hypothetical protein
MGENLLDKISKTKISKNLSIVKRKFIKLSGVREYSFFYCGDSIGHSRISIDDIKERVSSVVFCPLDFNPELMGNGIGQAAYFLMWEKSVLDGDIGLHYEMREDVNNMSVDYRNMLSKMGIFDNSTEYAKDAVFSTLVALLIRHTQRFLNENGYDVSVLLSNGIEMDFLE